MALRFTTTAHCARPQMCPARMGLTVASACSTSKPAIAMLSAAPRPSRTMARTKLVVASMLTPEQTVGEPSEKDLALDAEARQFAIACAEVADDTKCQDITCLHVAPLVSWTSYMVFATVFSKPQLLAALARIEKMVDETFPDRTRQNQPGSSPWECLDYGDVIIHLFTAEQRDTYDVEGFYAAAEDVDLPFAAPAPPTAEPQGPRWTTQF